MTRTQCDLLGDVSESIVQFAVNRRKLLAVTMMFIDRDENFIYQVDCFMHSSLQQIHTQVQEISATCRPLCDFFEHLEEDNIDDIRRLTSQDISISVVIQPLTFCVNCF